MIVGLLIVGGVIFVGVLVFVIFGGLIKVERDQDKAESSSDNILDAAFDGRPDVTFELNMRTLKYDTVIMGAKARGYKLVHQADTQYGPRTLMFEKTESTPPTQTEVGAGGAQSQ